MPQEVKINRERGIIEIRSYGHVSFQDAADTMSDVGQINRETGLSKVLEDARYETATFGTVHMFVFFSIVIPTFLRMATFVTEETKTKDQRHFGEIVATNGGYQVRLFNCQTEALCWLNRQSNEQRASENNTKSYRFDGHEFCKQSGAERKTTGGILLSRMEISSTRLHRQSN